MIDFSWQKSVVLKDGSKVILKYPTVLDAQKLQHFINPIVKEDTFILLDQQQTLNQEKAYLANIVSLMHQRGALKICGFVDEQIIAAADVTRYLYKQSHIGRCGIAIAQTHRGKGLGRILMSEIIKQAKSSLGIKSIELTCSARNVAGKKLYRSLGFVEYGLFPQAIYHKGEYVDQLHFFKQI